MCAGTVNFKGENDSHQHNSVAEQCADPDPDAGLAKVTEEEGRPSGKRSIGSVFWMRTLCLDKHASSGTEIHHAPLQERIATAQCQVL